MTSLAWFINGEAAPIGYLRGRSARRRLFSSVAGYPGSPFKSPSIDSDDDESSEDPSLYSPYEDSHSSPNGISNVKTLSIKFLVNPKHFINGMMKMKCVASSIPEAFSRTHEEVILAEPSSRGTSFPGRYSSCECSLGCHVCRHIIHTSFHDTSFSWKRREDSAFFLTCKCIASLSVSDPLNLTIHIFSVSSTCFFPYRFSVGHEDLKVLSLPTSYFTHHVNPCLSMSS